MQENKRRAVWEDEGINPPVRHLESKHAFIGKSTEYIKENFKTLKFEDSHIQCLRFQETSLLLKCVKAKYQ